MRRWHAETAIARRRQKRRLRRIREMCGETAADQAEVQLGRFRKQSEGDCGRARCYLCHSAKLMKQPRRDESIAELTLQEHLNA
jgi:hypothetical protein